MTPKKNKLNPLIARRVDPKKLEMEFNDSLNDASNMYFRNHDAGVSLAQFRNATLSMTMDSIHWEMYSTMPEEAQWYNDVFYMLRKYFDNKIEERYDELNNG